MENDQVWQQARAPGEQDPHQQGERQEHEKAKEHEARIEYQGHCNVLGSQNQGTNQPGQPAAAQAALQAGQHVAKIERQFRQGDGDREKHQAEGGGPHRQG